MPASSTISAAVRIASDRTFDAVSVVSYTVTTRAELSSRASTSTLTSETASRTAIAVQAKVLVMAHDSGRRYRDGTEHHGPLSTRDTVAHRLRSEESSDVFVVSTVPGIQLRRTAGT